MKEVEIEVFRAGGKASRGITPEHLAEVATFDCEANPVAVCFGHPKSDTPAAGTISGLRADGNRLFAKIKTLTADAIEGIKADKWLNRSFAFFDPTHEANPRPGKWSPRHLGLLGGAAPGIPGMGKLSKALAFSADDEDLLVDGDPADAVVYSGAATPVHFFTAEHKEPVTMDPTPEQITEANRLKAEREKLEADRNAFEASQRTAFEASNGRQVDALVAEGKVLPAEAADLKVVFNALDADVLTFSADAKDTASGRLSAFLSNALPKRVPVGDQISPKTQFDADGDKSKARSPAEITAAANQLVKDKGLTFEAAVAEVSGEQ